MKKETKKKTGFHWSCIVKDEETGCVFGLSATKDTIRIVPKYNSTFETYLKFFRLVVEQIDPDAKFVLMSEKEP